MGELCLGAEYGEKTPTALDCHGVLHTCHGPLAGGAGVVATMVVASGDATPGDFLLVTTDGTLHSYSVYLRGMVGLCRVPSGFGEAPVDSVSVGASHLLVLLRDGRVFSSGSNSAGCTGHGYDADRWYHAELTHVADEMMCEAPATCVAAGKYTSFVLRADDRVYAFGRNNRGQLGLGDTINRYWPTWQAALPGAASPVTICASTHALIVTRDGGMWTWGENDDGELGLGDTTPRATPARVPVEAICSALASFSNTLVLTMSGQVLGCGRHYRGVFEPVAGAPTSAVLALHCEGGGAIDVDGGVWRWNHEELGDGTYAHSAPQLLFPGLERYGDVMQAPLVLAVAMGAHPRLGEASALCALSDDLVRRVLGACVDWAPAGGESERAARSRGAPVLASLALYSEGVGVRSTA